MHYLFRTTVFEEKQSDVNIAVHMLEDAWLNNFDQAVLCTNDTDLVGALESLKKNNTTKRIGLVSPIREKPNTNGNRRVAGSFTNLTHWIIPWINPELIKKSQLPDKIPNTTIRKPDEWKKIEVTAS